MGQREYEEINKVGEDLCFSLVVRCLLMYGSPCWVSFLNGRELLMRASTCIINLLEADNYILSFQDIYYSFSFILY